MDVSKDTKYDVISPFGRVDEAVLDGIIELNPWRNIFLRKVAISKPLKMPEGCEDILLNWYGSIGSHFELHYNYFSIMNNQNIKNICQPVRGHYPPSPHMDPPLHWR